MMSNPACSPCVLLAAALLLAGCAGDTRTVESLGYIDKDLPSWQELHGNTAVGGVVLRQGVRIRRSPELPAAGLDLVNQADTWAPLLEQSLRGGRLGVDVMPYWQFTGRLTEAEQDSLLSLYAAGRGLPADLLGRLGGAEGPRYVLMGRIESDDVALESQAAFQSDRDQSPETGAPAGGPPFVDIRAKAVARPSGIRRTVRVTVDLYDLHNGYSLQTLRLETKRTGDGEAAPSAQGIAVPDSAVLAHPFYDPVDPWSGRGPAFTKVLEDAFEEIKSRLLPDQFQKALR